MGLSGRRRRGAGLAGAGHGGCGNQLDKDPGWVGNGCIGGGAVVQAAGSGLWGTSAAAGIGSSEAGMLGGHKDFVGWGPSKELVQERVWATARVLMSGRVGCGQACVKNNCIQRA